MKAAVIALIAAVALSSCATLQPIFRRQVYKSPRSAAAENSAETEVREPPLLWEVRSERGTLFLFGTMHFGVSVDQLNPVVANTLASCDTFVLESDPNAADQQRLADMMMLPNGSKGLDERLGPERWAKLLTMIDGRFEERVAKRLQPWVIEATVIPEILPTEQSMEAGLLDQAQKREISIEFLESWETQIEMLNKVSHADLLAEIVDDPDGFRERTQQMTVDYVSGDLTALERQIFGADYAAQDALFEDRNRSWMPKIDELARTRRAFVAVGAGHLLGPDSILGMLRERGYELRRLQ